MRIISYNMCRECCYCIDDYDNNGLCCKDNIYKSVKLNQSACRYFCGDDEDSVYQFDNINQPKEDDLLFGYDE